jgi:hypothetical protein
MEYLVKDDLPYIMMDDPNPFRPLDTLEQYLADLQAMPDFILKKETIGRVKELIAQKKRLEADRKMKGYAEATIERR